MCFLPCIINVLFCNKRGLGLALGTIFLHDFSIKMFLIYNNNKVLIRSMPYLFSFAVSRHQIECVID